MKKYTAVLIGAGSIGANKPFKFDSPSSDNVLTVANAFHRHPRIDFKYIVDVEDKEKIADKWKTGFRYYSDFRYKDNLRYDIIAVCTPTDTHNMVFEDILKGGRAKVILAEKPVTSGIEKINKLIELQKKSIIRKGNEIKHVEVSVDYIRRFTDRTIWLKRKVDNGELGEIYSSRVLYNRGIMRDGCHAIDLFNYFFGTCNKVKVLSDYKIIDLSRDDPTVAVHFEYDKCKNVQLTPIDGRKWSAFEFEICAEKGRYVFTDHGKTLEYYPVRKERTYGNYSSLSYDRKVCQTNLTTALMTYVDNAVKILDGKDHIHSSLYSAKQVHCIYDCIKNQIKGKV